MHRRLLLTLLTKHRPWDCWERRRLKRTTDFVRANEQCFERSWRQGHITGSAWLLDGEGKRFLLTHHRKLNKWLQLGGHADGDPDVLAVALREAREESGIENIEPVSREIFDVDVHRIPARNSESAHFHYDVRFLCRVVGDESIRVSDESHELVWVTSESLAGMDVDASVRRMHRKWLALPLMRCQG